MFFYMVCSIGLVYFSTRSMLYDVTLSVQEKMEEYGEEKKGGYMCSFPVFKGIYQMASRMTDRIGNNIYLMLCTLVDEQGNSIRKEEKTEELSGKLKESIANSIRRSDAFTQYGKTQYLVLLTNVTTESCELIQNRINHYFIQNCKRFGIRYRVNSVKCEI